MGSVYQERITDKIAQQFTTYKTVNLADYEMLSDKVVQVICATTGSFSPEELGSSIAQMFKGLATPIKGSFRRLTENSVIGFVSAVRTVKPYDPVTDGTKYRAIASNLLMDKEDETTWELAEGQSGKYLRRTGSEDLSELSSTLYQRRVGLPRLAHVAMASIGAKELVAFVDVERETLDYGFVCSKTEGGDLEVLSSTTKQIHQVSAPTVVQATYLDDEEFPVVKGMTVAAAGADREKMVDYYTRLYSYSPEYLSKVIDMIDQMAVA